MAVTDLPTLNRWHRHLNDELLPFWTTPAALGEPLGNFPTFRCNDGSAPGGLSRCSEMDELPRWLASEVGTEYTRMKSRQTYAYGVAFHITGDERFLTYARAGVEWLRKNAYEADTGSAITYWRDGKSGPPPHLRTTQDLAYAQLGLAFYYYLTRDDDVLGDLVRLEKHIFANYWEPSWGMLRWVRPSGKSEPVTESGTQSGTASDAESNAAGEAAKKELVAQLDQINAYMLLLAPLLADGPTAAAWKRDLVGLARVIKDRYFAPEHGLFWGTIHDPEGRKLGSRHTDFGHTIKALWMIYLTGQLVGDRELVEFARAHSAKVLERAAQPSGCWASGLKPSGSIDGSSQWWIFAELDQAAATMALRESDHQRYARFLNKSYECWFTRFVDRERGGIWPFIPSNWTAETFELWDPLKIFHWKSGYHSMEHALVALLTTAGLTGQPISLYYAFETEPPDDRIQPYFFAGTIATKERVPLANAPGLRGTKVTFHSVR